MVAKLSDRVSGNTLANPDDYVKKAGDTMTGSLTVEGVVEADTVKLGNNEQIRLGDNDDLQIRYNPAFGGFISNSTGNTYIDSPNGSISLRAGANSKNSLVCNSDSSTSLYHNGNLKLSTTNGGATVTGTLEADGVSLGTSEIIKMGANSDLQIFRSSTSGVIDHTNGGLFIQSKGGSFSIRAGSQNNNIIQAAANGGAVLSFNGSNKLNTTSGGVNVTGTLATDGIRVGNNEYISVGDTNDLSIFHSGTQGVIDNSKGTTYINSVVGPFIVRTGNTYKAGIRCDIDNKTSLYFNGLERLATTNAGGTLQGTWSGGGLSDERLKENIETRKRPRQYPKLNGH